MLMELLGRRSPAPAQDVARRILGSGWWARFTFNGITAYGNGAYSLIGGDELSDAERDALQQLCRQRLDAFREQRGEEVFAHRSPISGSVKYRVLTRALRGRCECCGARLLLSKPRTSGPWRWTTSCPKTRAAPTPSATCRRSGAQRPGAAGERIRSSASPTPTR
jgi:hypothetical protein